MARWPQALYVALVVSVAGCNPATTAPARPDTPAQFQPTPTRITAAITGEPSVINFALLAGGNRGGVQELEQLLNAGLLVVDKDGQARPQLAQSPPTVENGLWKLLPDGRMETTWRIRPDATWHDGTAFTAPDLVFTIEVGQDRDLPFSRHPAYDAVERVESTDPRTVTVHWKRPFINADTLFTANVALPMPAHLLKAVYDTDKGRFAQLPYWSDEYVGTGPYRLREYARGSHLVLDANERYVLGRPHIDQIEVRFIPDSRTLVANVLAGAIDLTLGWGLSLEQGIQVRDRWPDGKLDLALNTFILIYPQFQNPSPAVIANPQFLRALMHAIDRQQMADSIQQGMVPVAHTFLRPNSPQYRSVESALVKYDYDPRRADALVQPLGYTRGPDGIFADGANQRLSVELRSGGGGLEVNEKSVFAVADYWQRAGVAVNPLIVPVQQSRDARYQATRPGFELTRTSADTRLLRRLQATEIATPDNNFRGNTSFRYISSDLTDLIERYHVTIPLRERTEVLGRIVRHLTEQLPLLSLFYDVEPMLISARLNHVAATTSEGVVSTWNAHEWLAS